MAEDLFPIFENLNMIAEISLVFNKDVTTTSPINITLNNGKNVTIPNGTTTTHIDGSKNYFLTTKYTVTQNEMLTTPLNITGITSGKVKDCLENVLDTTTLNATVIATGFGKELEAANTPAARIIENIRQTRPAPVVEQPVQRPVQQVVNAPVMNNVDDDSETPAILRNANRNTDNNLPAFLRQRKN